MSKVDSTRIAAIKANFEHSDVITEENLADLIDAIAEAARLRRRVRIRNGRCQPGFHHWQRHTLESRGFPRPGRRLRFGAGLR